MLMEFCEGGEVFEFLFQTGKFQEETARFYFKQLLDGIEAVHSKGITHRDLKPENLLFDSNFNLKITDFGYSKYLSGDDGSGILKTHLGTESYMAPEIHEYKNYYGAQVDLFAAGIVLFIFKSQNPPFSKPNKADQLYRIFTAPNTNHQFWQVHSRAQTPGFFGDFFKNLINCMLAYNPQDRLSLAEVKAH